MNEIKRINRKFLLINASILLAELFNSLVIKIN